MTMLLHVDLCGLLTSLPIDVEHVVCHHVCHCVQNVSTLAIMKAMISICFGAKLVEPVIVETLVS